MATPVDWSSVDPQSKTSPGKPLGSGGKQKYIRWEAGHVYRLRPVGKAVQFYKVFYNGKQATVEIDQYDQASKSVASAGLLDKWNKPLRLQFKFAINVIDRADNQIKIMEAGTQVYKRFGSWFHINKVHPGSLNSGFDWAITVVGEGIEREYDAQHTTAAPITAEEKARFDNKEHYNLKEEYASISADKLIAFLTGTEKPENEAEPEENINEIGTETDEPPF